MNVGERIKQRRKQIGMSAETLAERLHLSPPTIYRYESGAIAKVDSTKLIQIAEVLGTTPAALMGWHDDDELLIRESRKEPPVRKPDYERAALIATETLIRHNVCAAPVSPLAILEAMDNVVVLNFTESADGSGLDNSREAILFGAENQDAVTFSNEVDGKTLFCTAFNQRLPAYMLQTAAGRQLGHILLGHDNDTPESIRTAEALMFMRSLICPRPLLKMLMDSGIALTIETIGAITGCFGRSLAGIRETPGSHVPAELNRRVRENFTGYVGRFLPFRSFTYGNLSKKPVDLGSFMDGYEE